MAEGQPAEEAEPCPTCHAPIPIPAGATAYKVRCPRCGTKVEVKPLA